GFYALRIRGFDAGGLLVHEQAMPVIRVANRVPDVKILAANAASSECGGVHVPIAGGPLAFVVTAWDPYDHLQSWTLAGSRGRDARSAGAALNGTRDASTGLLGVRDATVYFQVDPLPSPLDRCPAVAYSFSIGVIGSATDGYPGHWLANGASTNLVV